jgi:hypothetical protein
MDVMDAFYLKWIVFVGLALMFVLLLVTVSFEFTLTTSHELANIFGIHYDEDRALSLQL